MSPDVERTLVLIKPDGVSRNLVGEVLRRIEAKGYRITELRMLRASAEQLGEHYAEHAERSFYPPLVEYMRSAPVVAAIVEGHRVVEGVRTIGGATDPTTAAAGTIRGDLARDTGGAAIENLLHSSDSAQSAEREIDIWFPAS